MTSTATGFDLSALRRGLEQRDIDALLGLYADNAEVVEVSKRVRPARPPSSAARRKFEGTSRTSAVAR